MIWITRSLPSLTAIATTGMSDARSDGMEDDSADPCCCVYCCCDAGDAAAGAECDNEAAGTARPALVAVETGVRHAAVAPLAPLAETVESVRLTLLGLGIVDTAALVACPCCACAIACAICCSGGPQISAIFARTVAALQGFERNAVNPMRRQVSTSSLMVLAVTAMIGSV